MDRVYSFTAVALTDCKMCRILSMPGFCALILAMAIHCTFLLSADSRSRGLIAQNS